MGSTIIFIRHGHSNRPSGLTELGRNQLNLVAAHLKPRLADAPIRIVNSGPHLLESAQHFAKALGRKPESVIDLRDEHPTNMEIELPWLLARKLALKATKETTAPTTVIFSRWAMIQSLAKKIGREYPPRELADVAFIVVDSDELEALRPTDEDFK